MKTVRRARYKNQSQFDKFKHRIFHLTICEERKKEEKSSRYVALLQIEVHIYQLKEIDHKSINRISVDINF
jgi:hypothetical protein